MKPSRKKLLITGILLMMISFVGHANGDPVMSYSSINRVANPEPLSISEITITREFVNITHADGYNCFDVTYEFKNSSDVDFPEIHYGFPIDYLVADEEETYQFIANFYSESASENGWCDKLIKDVAFVFNGKELQFQSAKESVKKAGYEIESYAEGEDCDTILAPGINRRWYYTQFAMKPHSEATFNVRYKVYAYSFKDLYGANDKTLYPRVADGDGNEIFNHPLINRYFTSVFNILYDFTPAKHFGNGQAYPLYLRIDLSGLKSAWVNVDNYLCRTPYLERYYYSSPKDIEPINMFVRYSRPYSKNDIERVIAPLVTPASQYVLTTAGDVAEIDFHKPVFVSDIACNIDTAQVKSIKSIVTYADGHKKEYGYAKRAASADNTGNPVLLTITDLRHDTGELENFPFFPDFDSPKFKIKNIRLIFDRIPSTSSQQPFSNIRVLDARFAKP